ncbi:cell division protein DedD [Candidatus Nomurabacteria bacterium RIFCSPLOWO2_01_FULL_41_21]|uniref:Cell division protein DedD n=2 Tax=Candidatus Nomuraibacteriota TaxID=1752729 RepID=A0A1F6V3K5_9BACT|nr:MAG: cell division protein DedD [Candidatus Nomurabacteria bacterium RIFCSPHIGHO2_01_FULL_40_20]OGI88348.1 MAG: cell division protein DedD [Candidatus Nomurabacteria bacterium RIFCSPLOWO2_01_FULL_41_21]
MAKISKNTKDYPRPSWDEYFLEVMYTIGKRSSCDRGRSGCVITKDNRILATGYAGSPIGTKHCDDVGHELQGTLYQDGTKSMHCIRTAHAEQNAIVHAARVGTSLLDSTIYCNMIPCYACAKMIINAGVVKLVSKKDYHASKRTKEIFREAGIKFKIINKEVTKYKDQ